MANAADSPLKRKHDHEEDNGITSRPIKRNKRREERRAERSAKAEIPGGSQSLANTNLEKVDGIGGPQHASAHAHQSATDDARRRMIRAARKERKDQERNARQQSQEKAVQSGTEEVTGNDFEMSIGETIDKLGEEGVVKVVRNDDDVKDEDGTGDYPTNGLSKSRSRRVTYRSSTPTAGRYLDHDPIFVHDEQQNRYLVAATRSEIQILSISTSLVERLHAAPPGRTITAFTAVNDTAYIAYDDQKIWSWKWNVDGGKSRQEMTAPGMVRAITTLSATDGESLFYVASKKKGSNRIVCDDQTLHTTAHDVRSIAVLGKGEYVVAHGPSIVVLGSKKLGSGSETGYTWLEIPLTSPSTCIDARLIAQTSSSSKKAVSNIPGLRLAIGHLDGRIHLYDDISTLSRKEADAQLSTPRLLHWHRDAVSTLKFSHDGNYLISGGKETVLVLWQLETGHKQFLPHLTSELERLVVSPEGDRYAVQMGDNSIMVLNTSELKPVANFAGLQLLCPPSTILPSALSPPAAMLHPLSPHNLLLSVPASQPKSHNSILARPFLQTFDTRTSRHVSRQALTRNNVTDFNLGPERTPIIPPDVKFIALSSDGQWMATIDEWTPPDSDLESFTAGKADVENQRAVRREVYLKFWRWEEKEELWTLTTRVDSPHSRPVGEGVGAGVVRALVASPVKKGFATLGEDGCVRLWRSRRRMRSGVAVKNDADEEVVEWTCARTIRLPSDEDDRADSPMQLIGLSDTHTASLAYASDGSMLAAVHSTGVSSSLPVVYFIDTADGRVIPKTGITAAPVTSVGFVDRYFIAVSRPAVYIWDLVTDTLKHKIEIPGQEEYGSWRAPGLTTSAWEGSFALTTQEGGRGGRVGVYDPAGGTCLHSETFTVGVEAVLAGSGAKGYTVLFADATIRTLSPISGRLGLASSEASVRRSSRRITPSAMDSSTPVGAGPADLLGSASTAGQLKYLRSEEDDRPVVRPEQLAEIFEVGGVVMPPVKDMFRAVAGLFGRKPYVRPAEEVES